MTPNFIIIRWFIATKPPAGRLSARGRHCLAVENYNSRLRLQLREQVCRACDMRAYAAMVVTEVDRSTPRGDLAELRHH